MNCIFYSFGIWLCLLVNKTKWCRREAGREELGGELSTLIIKEWAWPQGGGSRRSPGGWVTSLVINLLFALWGIEGAPSGPFPQDDPGDLTTGHKAGLGGSRWCKVRPVHSWPVFAQFRQCRLAGGCGGQNVHCYWKHSKPGQPGGLHSYLLLSTTPCQRQAFRDVPHPW
jgi:hypothetical protein